MTDIDHDLGAPGLAEHLAAVREARPIVPRYAHEVHPRPDGWQYTSEWKHATDLPRQMARHHAAVAYGWNLALNATMLPGNADDLAHILARFIPAYELAWVWASIANREARDKHPDDWHIDLARDVVTDLECAPQDCGPNLLELLRVLHVDPAGIRAYGSET